MRDKALLLSYALLSAAAAVGPARGHKTLDDLGQAPQVVTPLPTAFHIPNAAAAQALREQRATPDVPPASVAE